MRNLFKSRLLQQLFITNSIYINIIPARILHALSSDTVSIALGVGIK